MSSIESINQRMTELEKALQSRKENAQIHQKTMESLFKQESELRAMLYGIGDAVIFTDREERVTRMNRTSEKLTGWLESEAVGMPLEEVFRIVNEATHCLVENPVTRVLRKSKIYGPANHTILISREGREIPIDDSAVPIFDRKNDITGAILIFRDRTKERLANLKYFESMDRVNRAIQETNDLEQMMHDVLDEVLSILDCERSFLMYPCDPEAEAWTVPMERSKPGYAGPVYTQKLTVPMVPEDSELLRLMIDTGEPLKLGLGTEHPLSVSQLERHEFQSSIVTALQPKIGKAWQFGIHQCSSVKNWTDDDVMLVREIGRRLTDGLTSLLMYRDLQESERFLNSIVENIPDMIFVKDAQTLKFVRLNRAGEKLLGYSRDELLGKNDYNFFPKEEANFFTAKDREVLDKKMLLDIPEERILTRSNEKRILHTKKIPILDETGTPHYLLGISEDITDRRHMDESIRKLSQAVAQSPVSIVITDATGDIEFVNRKFTEITGYSQAEAQGQNLRILKSGETPPEEYERLWKTISSGEIWKGEFHNRKKNGGLFWEQATISPIRNSDNAITHYVGIKEDISERKALEEQFRQAQKMESVGRLAGGVAHDFNNLLWVIMGHTELALEEADHDPQLTAHLQGIQKATKRSANLTRQLLAFARKQTVSPKVLDLNTTVEGTLKMLRRLIGEDIDLSWQPSENVWPVKMDPSQIDQILANLCINARDAIEDVGNITIETENIPIDETYGAAHAGFKPGDYTLLAVSDNGCGMNRNIIDNIFEPFFTTKELGKGTGLGLATVYGIVKQNNGFINVYSEPGQGTIFKIYLPRHESEGDQTSKKHESLMLIQGNETILVAEDEPAVLELACEILSRLGYRVLSAVSPEDAIRVANEYNDAIHLLITDVIMPEMNGPDLATAIKAIHPEITSLFMSGYTENTIAHHGVLDERFNFIQKPFTAQILSKKIREVLEKG